MLSASVKKIKLNQSRSTSNNCVLMNSTTAAGQYLVSANPPKYYKHNETSAFEPLYGGQFALSTQLIKSNYLVTGSISWKVKQINPTEDLRRTRLFFLIFKTFCFYSFWQYFTDILPTILFQDFRITSYIIMYTGVFVKLNSNRNNRTPLRLIRLQ